VKPEVVAVFGPTASGKSAVAEALADQLGTEVVSADALQVYRGLPILTNQPARPTRLVAQVPLQETMSVAAYATLAHRAIDALVAATGVAVVTGGTGLYLRAALAELAIPPAPAAGARERWERVYDADPDAAYARLAGLDPEAAASVHRNDRRRVVRALELAETGSSLVPDRDRLWSGEFRRPTALFGLDVPPEVLERRIEERTDAMFAGGVVAEVRSAIRSGVSATAERALGLREIAELPADEARHLLVVRTRRYAAYQRKWMRRIPDLVLVDATRSADEVASSILELVQRRQPGDGGPAPHGAGDVGRMPTAERPRSRRAASRRGFRPPT
jgi:tRNA dimethylallyltransferase